MNFYILIAWFLNAFKFNVIMYVYGLGILGWNKQLILVFIVLSLGQIKFIHFKCNNTSVHSVLMSISGSVVCIFGFIWIANLIYYMNLSFNWIKKVKQMCWIFMIGNLIYDWLLNWFLIQLKHNSNRCVENKLLGF